jgi:hypothetical protein
MRDELAKLLESRVRFLQRFLVFLCVDPGHDLVFLHFQPRPAQIVLCRLERAVILCLDDFLVGFFLRDLPGQGHKRILLVQEILQLRLRIEFHQNLLFLYVRAGRDQFGNHQRV